MINRSRDVFTAELEALCRRTAPASGSRCPYGSSSTCRSALAKRNRASAGTSSVRAALTKIVTALGGARRKDWRHVAWPPRASPGGIPVTVSWPCPFCQRVAAPRPNPATCSRARRAGGGGYTASQQARASKPVADQEEDATFQR